jgi:hypothetical protein
MHHALLNFFSNMEVAMALQLGALRDALIEARATPAMADKAAEEFASCENRLSSIDLKLD